MMLIILKSAEIGSNTIVRERVVSHGTQTRRANETFTGG